MSTNILIFFGWSVKYVSYTRVRATCNFVQKICEINKEVNPIFYFRNQKFYKYVEDILDSIPNSKHIIADISGKNWNEIKSDSIKIANEYNIDSILLSSMPIIKQYRLGQEDDFNLQVEKIYKEKDYSIKFQIIFNFFARYMPFIFMLNNNKNIKLYQYLDDPWEMDMKKIVENECKCIYEYNLDDRKVDIKIPFIGYSFFFKDHFETIRREKTLDFTTGFMVPYENIELINKKFTLGKIKESELESRILYAIKLDEIIHNFEKSNCKFLLFHKIKGRQDENVVSDIEFNNFIDSSRFSFIFPSPKQNEFPITRLYYCFARNCIPFIDSKINLQNGLFNENPELRDFFIKNNLVQPLDNIPNIINEFINKYDYIKSEMMQLKFFIQLTSSVYYENEFKKLFN